MRTAALILSVVLASSATSARAEAVPQTVTTPVTKQRGFLSGLGLGLLIGGLAGIGAGVGGLIGANEAQGYLNAYGTTFDEAQRPTVNALTDRLGGSTALAMVGFIGGGLALAGGILCLAIDTPGASVAFLPTARGGVFVLTARF